MFTIDTENNIAAVAEAPASTDNLQLFSTEKELAKLASAWPVTRPIELWNSFVGVTPFTDLKPVKKFTSRKLAVSRIWAAVQRLADAAEPVRAVAPLPSPQRSPGPRPHGAPARRRTRTNRAATRRRTSSR